tara:strand:- start:1553 stop:1831 length:279 start_codon:yes stop_codon:yes gene_type:complete
MYILTMKNADSEGAYAVITEDGEKVLQLFEELDDAERYIGLLEADGFPKIIESTEIEGDQAVAACEKFGYNYVIITSDDIVIPPQFESHDFI